MARLRLPLYTKILLWFMANLLVLALLGFGFMRAQFRLEHDWMLAGAGGERLEQFSESLTAELRNHAEADWPEILRRHEAALGLTLALFGSDGAQKLGPPLEVPAAVLPKLLDKRRAEDMPPPARPGRVRELKPLRDAPPKPRFMVRAGEPPRTWAGIHLTLAHGEGAMRRPLTLVMVSESPTGHGFFFDPWPWAALVAGGLAISALIWLPVVGGITRFIRRANEASKRIATGSFDTRLAENRSDELGELAASVNTMAAQLGEYVSEQRRITADVAHELCSPIARMQMALGVLEQRGTAEQADYLAKLDRELQHMARLVEEVLAFSRAEALPEREAVEEVSLRELVDTVVAREAPDTPVRLDIADLRITTLRSALDRAVGNVLRNAVRYAKDIDVSAAATNAEVIICIRDRGPGVPEAAVPHLFEPFYRPESARGRHTGGSGLGLAIAKRCIQACGGTITARNRDQGGLEVEIVLPAMLKT